MKRLIVLAAVSASLMASACVTAARACALAASHSRSSMRIRVWPGWMMLASVF